MSRKPKKIEVRGLVFYKTVWDSENERFLDCLALVTDRNSKRCGFRRGELVNVTITKEVKK